MDSPGNTALYPQLIGHGVVVTKILAGIGHCKFETRRIIFSNIRAQPLKYHAATATGASLMPPVGEADFGMLEAGKSADLIVLDADPLTDIRNTLEIDQVMQRGEWVERDGLLPTP